MKKTILLTTTILLSLLTFIAPAKAETKVTLKQTSNGNINTKLHFEEGFVGGVDVAFKVNGNVNVQNFSFDNNIVSKKAIRNYKYDKNSKLLTVRVTAGGIGTSHNLLNESKELNLGNIVLASTAMSTVNYSLTPSTLKIVDNGWNSQKLDLNENKQEFSYTISKLDDDKIEEYEPDPIPSPKPAKKEIQKSPSSKVTSKSYSKKTPSIDNSKINAGSSNNSNPDIATISGNQQGSTITDDATDDKENTLDEQVTTDDNILDDGITSDNNSSNNAKNNNDSSTGTKKKKKKNVIPFVIGTGVIAIAGIYVTLKNRY